MPKNKQHVQLMVLAGLLLGLMLLSSGCVGYVDPGPNPAELQVALKAAVPQAAVQAVKRDSFRSVTGPYWVWWVYWVDGKGLYHDLQPKGAGPERWKEAYALNESAVFLVKPGSYQVRLRVTAYLDYEIRGGDRGGSTIKSVPIADWHEDIMLKLGPGQSRSYFKDFGTKLD